MTVHHVDLKMSKFMGMLSPQRQYASTNKINQRNTELMINKQSILTKVSKCPREMDACNVQFCTKNENIKGIKQAGGVQYQREGMKCIYNLASEPSQKRAFGNGAYQYW